MREEAVGRVTGIKQDADRHYLWWVAPPIHMGTPAQMVQITDACPHALARADTRRSQDPVERRHFIFRLPVDSDGLLFFLEPIVELYRFKRWKYDNRCVRVRVCQSPGILFNAFQW